MLLILRIYLLFYWLFTSISISSMKVIFAQNLRVTFKVLNLIKRPTLSFAIHLAKCQLNSMMISIYILWLLIPTLSALGVKSLNCIFLRQQLNCIFLSPLPGFLFSIFCQFRSICGVPKSKKTKNNPTIEFGCRKWPQIKSCGWGSLIWSISDCDCRWMAIMRKSVICKLPNFISGVLKCRKMHSDISITENCDQQSSMTIAPCPPLLDPRQPHFSLYFVSN